MKKFLVLYMAPTSAEERMGLSPEAAQKEMELWMAWFGKCGDAIVDGGTPLAGKLNMTKAGTTGAKAQIAGYTVLQGADMDAVKALITDHPHFGIPGASIEVLEYLPTPGM